MEQLLGLVGHWVPCGVDLGWVMGATGKGITPKKKQKTVASARCCLQRHGMQEGKVWLLPGEAEDTAMPSGR